MTTARDICVRAFRELRMYPAGEPVPAEHMAQALDALNGLVASWHNKGLLIFYPPGKTWVGDWKVSTTYNVNDAVARNGNTYYCTAAVISAMNDQPGVSPNWSSYWTLYAETPMSLDSTFFLDASHERGVSALLALELQPAFGAELSPLTIEKAKDGMNALYGAFFHVPTASVDAGIVRMPSQIWPYQIPSVASSGST